MKKGKVLLSLLLCGTMLLGIVPVKAKTINQDWQKNYGGNSLDVFKSVIQTTDGGYVAAGDGASTDINGITNKGSYDAIIVKYNKGINVEWQKNYGGSGIDEFASVIQTTDGDYVAVGYVSSTDIDGITNKGSNDAIIVKYDKDGNIKWQKNYGGSSDDLFTSVVQTTDGGYVVSGYASSIDINGITNKGSNDAIIVKYDKDGNIKWQKNYGGSDDDRFRAIVQTTDGGYVAAGDITSTDIDGISNNGLYDAIIVKYDKEGNIEWQKNYGGSSGDLFKSVIQTTDGGYVAAGDTFGITYKGDDDAVIIKYDKDGNVEWQKIYGGSGSDFFNSVIQEKDGGYVAVGYAASTDIEGITNKGEQDAIIVKYDKDGNIKWQKNYGGSKNETYYSIIQIADGGHVVTGNSSSTDIDGITNKGSYDAIIVKYTYDYDITTKDTANGTYSIDKEKALYNELVTITIDPNANYRLKAITGVTTTKVNDTTYTFNMPNDDVKIGVEYELISTNLVDNPNTSDNILLYVGITIVSIMGLVGFSVYLKQQNN